MCCPWGSILSLNIGGRGDWDDDFTLRSIDQEISRIPVNVRNLSTLELQLPTEHVYGAMLLDLLRLCSSIEKLKVTLNPYCQVTKACSVDCPCDQPDNWRSQFISLTNLKEVYIKGFRG
ncbi:unnamed protein product [Urochloa humidicola]